MEPLIAALEDPNADVRQATTRALGTTGDQRAVQPLIADPRQMNWNEVQIHNAELIEQATHRIAKITILDLARDRSDSADHPEPEDAERRRLAGRFGQ